MKYFVWKLIFGENHLEILVFIDCNFIKTIRSTISSYYLTPLGRKFHFRNVWSN